MQRQTFAPRQGSAQRSKTQCHTRRRDFGAVWAVTGCGNCSCDLDGTADRSVADRNVTQGISDFSKNAAWSAGTSALAALAT